MVTTISLTCPEQPPDPVVLSWVPWKMELQVHYPNLPSVSMVNLLTSLAQRREAGFLLMTYLAPDSHKRFMTSALTIMPHVLDVGSRSAPRRSSEGLLHHKHYFPEFLTISVCFCNIHVDRTLYMVWSSHVM